MRLPKLPPLPGLPALPQLPSFTLPGLPEPDLSELSEKSWRRSHAIELWRTIKQELCDKRTILDATDELWRSGCLDGADLIAVLAHFGFELPLGIGPVHVQGIKQHMLRNYTNTANEGVVEVVKLRSPITIDGKDWHQLRSIEPKEIFTEARSIAYGAPETNIMPEQVEAEFARLEELLK